MFRHHLNMGDVANIYAKYLTSWGDKSAVWEFVGFKNGQEFARKKVGASNEFHFALRQTKEALVNDSTYDAARVVIEKLDQFDTKMPYADEPLSLSVEGPIALMGPSLVNLEAGALSIYVRSLPVKKKAEAALSITTAFGETVKVNFTVE